MMDEVRDALIGRTIVNATKDGEFTGELVLDNGTVLELTGNEGGCSCGAGDYFLERVATVANAITGVEFVEPPEYEEGYSGTYSIFVLTEADERIEVAGFDGDDGNGYYGTGYSVQVKVAE